MCCLTRIIVVLAIVATITLTSNAQYVLPITKHDPSKTFYTTFDIGATVKSPVNLLLDLGTTLTWANCRKIKSLSSLRIVHCDATCRSIPDPGCEMSRQTCLFRQPYPLGGKNPFVIGRVVQDTATITSSTDGGKTHSPVSFRPFTFYCNAEKNHQNIYSPVVGILGLSRGGGDYTFWRQVTKAFNVIPQFALCLPSSGAGKFYIGGVPDIASTTMTPIKSSASGDYLITVNSIYVDGTPLSLSPSLLNDGAKLSTVVPYTVLHSDIYNALAQSFTLKAKAMGISEVSPVAPFKNCYDAHAAGGKNMPVIELGLPGRIGEVKWTFHGTNTVVNVKDSVMCLAFIDGGEKPKENIVVGTYQLQNYLLKFDMSMTVLAFSDSLLLHNTSCSA